MPNSWLLRARSKFTYAEDDLVYNFPRGGVEQCFGDCFLVLGVALQDDEFRRRFGLHAAFGEQVG